MKPRIQRLSMMALFAALCYVVLMFIIPMPSMFVHFGNMVLVIAALLIGGPWGGLSCAVGMTISDLTNGHADSAPKTFVLKLLIGIIIGAVFSLRKEDRFPKKSLFAVAAIVMAGAVGIFIYCMNVLGPVVYILCIPLFLLGAGLMVFSVLGRKLSPLAGWAYIAAICGLGFNLFGETVYKTVYMMLVNKGSFSVAVVYGITSQASTLINAVIAVVGGVSIYLMVRKPYEALKY